MGTLLCTRPPAPEKNFGDEFLSAPRIVRLVGICTTRFLPPQVADLIVASGSEKQLESHRREITALFCDLRGFTGFTESADAEDVMARCATTMRPSANSSSDTAAPSNAMPVTA
jgi:class 3 adenylate cyclase